MEEKLSKLLFGIFEYEAYTIGDQSVGAMLETVYPVFFIENAMKAKVSCIVPKENFDINRPCLCLIVSLASTEPMKTLKVAIKTAGQTKTYTLPSLNKYTRRMVAIFLPDYPLSGLPMHHKVIMGADTKIFVELPPKIVTTWN